MIRRKKIAKLKRQKYIDLLKNNKEAINKKRKKEISDRKKRLVKYKEQSKKEFKKLYRLSLQENTIVGSGDDEFKAYPCIKKRSVLDNY